MNWRAEFNRKLGSVLSDKEAFNRGMLRLSRCFGEVRETLNRGKAGNEKNGSAPEPENVRGKKR